MNRTEVEVECYRAAVVYDGVRFWIPTLSGDDLQYMLSHFMNAVDYCVLTSEQICALGNDSDPVIALTRLLDMEFTATIILATEHAVCCRTKTQWHWQKIRHSSRNDFARMLSTRLRIYKDIDIALQTVARTARIAPVGELPTADPSSRVSGDSKRHLKYSVRSSVTVAVVAFCAAGLWLFR